MNRLLDGLWPRQCEICGGAVDRPARCLCADCLMRVPFLRPDEAKALEAAGADAARGFDRLAAVFHFEEPARRMLLDYKFNHHLWLRDDFTDWMEAAVRTSLSAEAVDLVLPMPSHLLHRLDRGFNPCVFLAKALAARLDRRCEALVLRRTGWPRRQAGLSADERIENVKGTFAVRRPDLVAGRTVLIVDDVTTTGATLSECARTLRAAGAWRVWALALATAS